MARKQTLKSLLGASDERVQTELRLDAPNLQTTVRGTSGGSTYVASQPESQLFKVSKALGSLNNKLAQYSTDRLRDQETIANIANTKAKTDLVGKKLDFVNDKIDFENFASENLYTFVEERKAELNKTEDELDRVFQNEYNLNPMNAKRAQSLAGAQLRGDMLANIERGITQAKEEMLASTNGEPLDNDQIANLVDDIIGNFVEERGLSGNVKNGLLKATENDRLQYTTKLPAQLQEFHQDEVIVKRTASALLDVVDSYADMIDIVDGESVNKSEHQWGGIVDDEFTRAMLETQVTETLRNANGLPPSKMESLMKTVQESISNEDADVGAYIFEEIAKQAKIGTQSYSDRAEFTNQLADLDERAFNYRKEIFEKRTVRTAELTMQREPEVDKQYATGGLSAVEEYRNKQAQRIEEMPDGIEKEAHRDALEKVVNEVTTRHDRLVTDVKGASNFVDAEAFKLERADDIASEVSLKIPPTANNPIYKTNIAGETTLELSDEARAIYESEYEKADIYLDRVADSLAKKVHAGTLTVEEAGIQLTTKAEQRRAQFDTNIQERFTSLMTGENEKVAEEAQAQQQKVETAEQLALKLENIITPTASGNLSTQQYKSALKTGLGINQDIPVFMALNEDWQNTVSVVQGGLLNPEETPRKDRGKSKTVDVDMFEAREQVVDYASDALTRLQEDYGFYNKIGGATIRSGDTPATRNIRKRITKQNLAARQIVGFEPTELNNILGTEQDGSVNDRYGFRYAVDTLKDTKQVYIKGAQLPENKEVVTALAERLGITYQQLLTNQAQLRERNYIRD